MRDLSSLAVCAEVAEAQSFSAAARRLKIPVSTVSRRIAELEDQLGVRLLERSTRRLRLTDVGAEVVEHARHSAELCEAVDSLISNSRTEVSGTLRLATPPSISDSLIVPVVSAFQASYPKVRVQVLVTERIGPRIPDDVDLAVKVGTFTHPSLISHRLLTYRHQLVASPAYLAGVESPHAPRDLLGHRLLAFSFWEPGYSWHFAHANGHDRETLTFQPCIAMNDYTSLASALLAGVGIGELPPLVQPELLRQGLLVEVMPDWRLPLFDLSVAHLRAGHLAQPVRLFKEFATQMVPGLFPALPT